MSSALARALSNTHHCPLLALPTACGGLCIGWANHAANALQGASWGPWGSRGGRRALKRPRLKKVRTIQKEWQVGAIGVAI